MNILVLCCLPGFASSNPLLSYQFSWVILIHTAVIFLFCSRIKVPLFACTEAALFPLPGHLRNDRSVICSAQFLTTDIQIITHLFCSFPPELSTVPFPSFLLEWNRWTGRNPCVWKQVWGLVCSFFFFFGLTRHAENRFESNRLEKGNTNFKSLVALIQSDT